MASNSTLSWEDAIFNSQAILLQTFFVLPAITLYILVMVVILKFYKSWKNPFFNILISLSVADIYYQFEILCYCIPCIVLQTHIYGDIVDQILGVLDTTIWFTQISHLLYVAINRLVFAASSEMKVLDTWFSQNRVCVSLSLIWVFGFGISLLMVFGSCQKPFHYDSYYFGFECSNTETGNIVLLVNEVISNVFPALSFFIYIVVWKLIRDRHKKVAGMIQQSVMKRRNKEEFWMSVQFTLICATNVFVGISFWIVPRFLTSKSGSILLGIFAIWNAGINPFLYITMNSNIKEKTNELLFGSAAKEDFGKSSLKPTRWDTDNTTNI